MHFESCTLRRSRLHRAITSKLFLALLALRRSSSRNSFTVALALRLFQAGKFTTFLGSERIAARQLGDASLLSANFGFQFAQAQLVDAFHHDRDIKRCN